MVSKALIRPILGKQTSWICAIDLGFFLQNFKYVIVSICNLKMYNDKYLHMAKTATFRWENQISRQIS